MYTILYVPVAQVKVIAGIARLCLQGSLPRVKALLTPNRLSASLPAAMGGLLNDLFGRDRRQCRKTFSEAFTWPSASTGPHVLLVRRWEIPGGYSIDYIRFAALPVVGTAVLQLHQVTVA